MNTNHLYRAKLQPVPDGIKRPLWSVMIPTYHCADYLREALSSVLAQDPGPEIMQIEVIDDHSTRDDPAVVIEELGCGRVGFYRQQQNVGYIKNFETCLQRSNGKLIHILHGDDYVREGFYNKLGRAFELHPEIGAAFCRHILVNEEDRKQQLTWLEQHQSGILSNWLGRIVVEQRIQTPAIVVRREVYERLGGFDHRFSCAGEDWEMWIRIAAEYPVWFEVEPLAMYRMHTNSLSGRSRSNGQYARDLSKTLDIVGSYLSTYMPDHIAEQLLFEAKENLALGALSEIYGMIERQDLRAAIAESRAVLRWRCSMRVIDRMVHLYLWAIARFIRLRISRG
jgi:GT2 family glycosyltransferase